MVAGMDDNGMQSGNSQPMVMDDIAVAQARAQRNYAFLTKLFPSLLAAADCLVLLAAGYGCYYGLVPYSYKSESFYHVAINANWLVTVMIFQFAGLYQFDAMLKPRASIDRVVIAIMTSFLLMFAAAFSLKISGIFSRAWIAVFFLACVSGVIATRFVAAGLVHRLAEAQMISRRVAVYGRLPQIERFLRFARETQDSFIGVTGIFLEPGEEAKDPGLRRMHRGGFDELMTFARSQMVDDIILAMPWSDGGRMSALVNQLRELPTNVHVSADVAGYEVRMSPPPSYYEQAPLYQVVGQPLSGWDVVFKAAFDYVMAAVLLVVLSPLLLAVAIAIKIDSRGPILFRQQRFGFNTKVFGIYKFRTMVDGEATAATVQARAGDPRITRIGGFLRKTSIDELPQLLNVLSGTMSLVGPRPHAVDHNEEYSKKIRGYFARHRMKPGITGLAQIKGYRGLTDTVEKMEQRVKYDILYTDTWSPWLDFKILLLTPFAVATGENAI